MDVQMTLPNDLEKLRDEMAKIFHASEHKKTYILGWNAAAEIFLRREAELKENPHGSDFAKKLIEKLKDLEDQAKTEKSHFYTASLLRETIRHLETNYDDVALKEIFEMQRRDFEHLQYQLSTAKELLLKAKVNWASKTSNWVIETDAFLEKLRPSDSEAK